MTLFLIRQLDISPNIEDSTEDITCARFDKTSSLIVRFLIILEPMLVHSLKHKLYKYDGNF